MLLFKYLGNALLAMRHATRDTALGCGTLCRPDLFLPLWLRERLAAFVLECDERGHSHELPPAAVGRLGQIKGALEKAARDPEAGLYVLRFNPDFNCATGKHKDRAALTDACLLVLAARITSILTGEGIGSIYEPLDASTGGVVIEYFNFKTPHVEGNAAEARKQGL